MRRVPLWLCRLIVTGLVLAPLAAMGLGAVTDFGPNGSIRFTAFALALAGSDSSVREAIRNSLILATCVSLVATIVGSGLARIVTSHRFRGRDVLCAISRAIGAVPPVFGAVGLVGLGWAAFPGEGRLRWLALAWLHLAWAAPRVMSAAVSSLERIPPSWREAAEVAGASRSRSWWVASWPSARPRVARAVAGVFAVVLIEPTAPMVLGVRRSLGFTIVDAALGNDGLGQAAALGMVSLVLAFVGRTLILWRGGPEWPLPTGFTVWRMPWASWWSAMVSRLMLMLWIVVGGFPLVAMGITAFGFDRAGRFSLAGFGAILRDRESLAILADSAILGLVSTILAIGLASGLGSRDPIGHVWRRPWLWISRVPALLFGLGFLLLPRVLGAMAGRGSRVWGIAEGLDPYGSPWILLSVCVALIHVPMIAKAFHETAMISNRGQEEVARSLGASSWIAWRAIRLPRIMMLWSGPLAWCFVLCALEAAPAVLLSPTLAARPIIPAALMIVKQPGGMQRAAVLCTMAMVLPLAAGIMARKRSTRDDRQ